MGKVLVDFCSLSNVLLGRYFQLLFSSLAVCLHWYRDAEREVKCQIFYTNVLSNTHLYKKDIFLSVRVSLRASLVDAVLLVRHETNN